MSGVPYANARVTIKGGAKLEVDFYAELGLLELQFVFHAVVTKMDLVTPMRVDSVLSKATSTLVHEIEVHFSDIYHICSVQLLSWVIPQSFQGSGTCNSRMQV
jgi:hypothetical protein